MNPFEMLFLLIVAHCLADYALQGDFMAKAKNHRNSVPGVPWQTVLASHSIIHAGAVFLITRNPICALIELVGHAIIDYLKCDNQISYNTDQQLHIAMKVLYVIALSWS